MRRVVLEPARRRKSGGIEIAAPVFVLPPGAADPYDGLGWSGRSRGHTVPRRKHHAIAGSVAVQRLPRQGSSAGSYCGGRSQTDGSSFHTPRQRRHSHQRPAEPSPRLRTSVLPQRIHDTGRWGSVARRPPRMTFRRSGTAGLRRSISGHVGLTLRLYPEEDAWSDLGICLTAVSVKGAQI